MKISRTDKIIGVVLAVIVVLLILYLACAGAIGGDVGVAGTEAEVSPVASSWSAEPSPTP